MSDKFGQSWWSTTPGLQIGGPRHCDEYRLREGRVEFKPAAGRGWRELAYPDIQQHVCLGTPVGEWLGSLHSTAKLGQVLST